MQNTNSGSLCFRASQTNMDVSSYDITIKVPKCTKYEVKAKNFFIVLVCTQYLKLSFNFMS